MIRVEEARERILNGIDPLGRERVALTEAAGRVLAEAVDAPVDHPPWDTSAMDGYAVRVEETRGASKSRPVLLRVVEEIPAGRIPERPIGTGESSRIMTGAPLPRGADAVVKIEDSRRGEGSVEIFSEGDPDFIRKKGEAIGKGQRLLSEGSVLRPAEIALLASVGRSLLTVYRRPTVSILATGDELADLDEPRGPEKILNSNSYGLGAAVRSAGGRPILLGIARDDPEALRRSLSEAQWADMVLVSGGVSMGDYDFVREVLTDLGVELAFWKVAMKPGAPLAFGRISGKPVFGLPGNPVSALVTFEQFVRPALLKASGLRQLFRPMIRAVLAETVEKAAGKRHFMRAVATVEDGRFTAKVTRNQDSHVLTSLTEANAFLIVPEETTCLKAGEEVWIELLN